MLQLICNPVRVPSERWSRRSDRYPRFDAKKQTGAFGPKAASQQRVFCRQVESLASQKCG
ncbi:hypothetical protein CIT25_27465 [Mesorhizobium mediterraneum]|uniref:Uncharacterized protein n=1 Tax=Mesorhizobium mediterraneum TaxID=43617 RepID=A0AB36R320_9HYPH|nr:hypothetical protein CIT25_27465 [Mesorhizobium mediterraneum]